jgi:hypothetical protein
MDDLASFRARLSELTAPLDTLQPPASAENSPPTRVLHIVPDLRTGGAETMLVRLINNGDRNRFEHRVLSMRSKGDLAQSWNKQKFESMR